MAGAAAALRLIAGIALALASVAGCGGPTAARSTDTVTATVEAARLPAGIVVRVEMFNGDVTIDPSTSGGIEAIVTRTGAGSSSSDAATARDAIEVTSGVTGNEAFVRARYAPNPDSPDSNAASASVKVPAGSALIVRTSNGAVRIAGFAGPLNVHTSNGKVDVWDATAGLAVETSNGSISTTAGGGLMALRTSNGAVTVSRASAARLSVESSSGEVSFDGSLAPGASTIVTSNAAVRVALPRDASFHLEADTSNAKATVEGLGFVGGPTADLDLVGDAGANPTTILSIRTSNGSVGVTPAH